MSETMFGTGIWLLMMLTAAAAVILPFWFIFSKAGYSKWLCLLMVVPLVNVALLYFLAFAKWSGPGNGNTQGHLPREH